MVCLDKDELTVELLNNGHHFSDMVEAKLIF